MAIQYQAIIQQHDDMDAAFCDVLFDVEATFGKKRVKIKAMIDSVVYRGLLTPMGGKYHLILTKAIRKDLGKGFGDSVNISIEEDTEPRVIEIPDDLLEAMQLAEVKPFFDSLSYTHQKEYVVWIKEAKKEETRQNRILKAIEMLKNKIKTR